MHTLNKYIVQCHDKDLISTTTYDNQAHDHSINIFQILLASKINILQNLMCQNSKKK